jgi:hypothetical protein
MELESNTVERSIRPLTLNRKNALFAGTDDIPTLLTRLSQAPKSRKRP